MLPSGLFTSGIMARVVYLVCVGLLAGAADIRGLKKENPIQQRFAFDLPQGNLLELYNNRVGNKPYVRDFKYDNCGSSADPLKLNEVQVKHTTNGDLILTANGVVGVDVVAPVKVESKLDKKMFGVWLPIPCIGSIGSCDYNNICKYGMDTCPFKALTDNKIPCKCPVSKGSYGVANAEFPVPRIPQLALLLGDYHFKIVLKDGANKQLACYSGSVSIGESPK